MIVKETTQISDQNCTSPLHYSVLVIDDEPDVTATLKKGLETCGPFDVQAFNDAEQALAALAQFRFHIMIIDLRMPKMDGFEFYERARKLDESPCVIFITASDAYNERYKQKYPKWNGDCFIMKPVSVSLLAKFLLREIEER